MKSAVRRAAAGTTQIVRVVTQRIEHVREGVGSAAGAEELDGGLDVVVAVGDRDGPVLQQQRHGQGPAGERADEREARRLAAQVLDGLERELGVTADDGDGVGEVSCRLVLVHLLGNRDQAVVTATHVHLRKQKQSPVNHTHFGTYGS